ncbi:hypothetical protein Bequi_01945 [Brachybacterium sp. JHP9]|uniref:Uncharacterized protein n=1 Tax=Brachybacterium equifaecis TaxID=2910770 RepID=A0ABT0QYS3_9MICO|nr:hypothetical protein [Brachybacterium equifaecis]MCL6422164.1 hypothetical protein [Brachybacterium equifaecis]
MTDTRADNNRIYANYGLNTGTRGQLITKSSGQSISQTFTNGKLVANFQACTDRPWDDDSCGEFIYI